MKDLKSDSLLKTFSEFALPQNESEKTIGGRSTSGFSYDEDGCSAVWYDTPDGGCVHMEDRLSSD